MRFKEFINNTSSAALGIYIGAIVIGGGLVSAGSTPVIEATMDGFTKTLNHLNNAMGENQGKINTNIDEIEELKTENRALEARIRALETTSPPDTTTTINLSGTGDGTRTADLTSGRYNIDINVNNNHNSNLRPTNLMIRMNDTSNNSCISSVNQIVARFSRQSPFVVGNQILDNCRPGVITIDVVATGDWTITITKL